MYLLRTASAERLSNPLNEKELQYAIESSSRFVPALRLHGRPDSIIVGKQNTPLLSWARHDDHVLVQHKLKNTGRIQGLMGALKDRSEVDVIFPFQPEDHSSLSGRCKL